MHAQQNLLLDKEKEKDRLQKKKKKHFTAGGARDRTVKKRQGKMKETLQYYRWMG